MSPPENSYRESLIPSFDPSTHAGKKNPTSRMCALTNGENSLSINLQYNKSALLGIRKFSNAVERCKNTYPNTLLGFTMLLFIAGFLEFWPHEKLKRYVKKNRREKLG